MNETIDIYCERMGPEFWAEPLNAVSNLSFIIAAMFALKLAKDKEQINVGSLTLIALLAIIGTGSFLFHTFATFWAMLSDTIPILLFQIAFLVVYSRYVIDFSWVKTAGLFGAFLIFIFGFGILPSDWLNGSLSYAPALIFLGGFGLWHYFNAKQERITLLAATGVLAVSLTFRSIDMSVCDSLPIGVHYMWHILNGIVLYLAARAYIIERSVRSA